MLSISTEKELSIYHLEGKWNDYVGVQKEVISVLSKLKFFENKDVVNVETGMVVRITTRGIKETIGNLIQIIFIFIMLIQKKVLNYSAHLKRR